MNTQAVANNLAQQFIVRTGAGVFPNLARRQVGADLLARINSPGKINQGAAGLGHPSEQVQSGENTVTGGGVFGHDHVSALFTAEDESTIAHGFQNVPIADSCFDNSQLGRLDRQAEAKIGHHRGDNSVVDQSAALT